MIQEKLMYSYESLIILKIDQLRGKKIHGFVNVSVKTAIWCLVSSSEWNTIFETDLCIEVHITAWVGTNEL